MRIEPIGATFAGEVSGVDITRQVTDETIAASDETQIRDMRRTTVAGIAA
jgi:hypothetical protein